MTPRQIDGWFKIALKAMRRERSERLSLQAIGAGITIKDAKERFKEIMDDGDGI